MCRLGVSIKHLDQSFLSKKYSQGKICPQNKVSLFDAKCHILNKINKLSKKCLGLEKLKSLSYFIFDPPNSINSFTMVITQKPHKIAR